MAMILPIIASGQGMLILMAKGGACIGIIFGFQVGRDLSLLRGVLIMAFLTVFAVWFGFCINDLLKESWFLLWVPMVVAFVISSSYYAKRSRRGGRK